MNHSKRNRPARRRWLATAFFALLALLPFSSAQDLAALEGEVEDFQERAQSIYRFNDEAMRAIWEAYCGLLDPNSEDYNKDFAFEIGLDYQQQQEDQWEELMGQVDPLIEALETLQENPETEDRAEELLEIVTEEASKLQRLEEDVVLKGANHPFVQFAINYGVQKHKDLCSSEGEDPKICDKTWPTLDGRPDLVYVDDGLWILEFKPDNDRARSEGERQVLEYVEGVEDYFQDFFPQGRQGSYTSTPDSDHGGEEILKKLLATDEAWSGDEIIARFDVVTYDRCEEPY